VSGDAYDAIVVGGGAGGGGTLVHRLAPSGKRILLDETKAPRVWDRLLERIGARGG
jgi:choline dehydrogenase-like flavoprotein